MAAVAAGDDPYHFGGTAPENDLVARLLATQQTTGADAGLFGTQVPNFDGAFRQGLALAALKAAKVKTKDPHVRRASAWLTAQQCPNGLFEPYRVDTALPCDPVDPLNFTGPDTNSTAMALQGLAALGQEAAEDRSDRVAARDPGRRRWLRVHRGPGRQRSRTRPRS